MGCPPYQAAIRLVALAEDKWAEIDGEAASRGIDYLDLPFDRFLNAIYWWFVQRVKDPAKFLAELNRGLGETGPTVTEEELEADARSFMAFAAMMGVKPGSDENRVGALPSQPSV